MGSDVIVCNLTRFGDLLQSQAVIDDLHESGHSVGLVCLDNFAGALPLLRNVGQVWPLPGSALLAGIERSWPQTVAGLLRFANSINDAATPKNILNLTPSLPARLLAKLLVDKGASLLGFGLDEFGYGLNQGIWSSFLAVAAAKRINSPFNVADMFRKLALPLTGGFQGSFRLAEPSEDARAWVRNFLVSQTSGIATQGFVAFQLGASEERRRWPVENFRLLGAELWRQMSIVPVLLGTKSEAHLAEEYAQNAGHPFVDAAGKTGLAQLAALLKETRLLVTNDTGTMHLASGMGLHSLSFFLATAQPWDTGPLLANCCCLEPALSCHPCAFGQECPRKGGCRSHIGPQSAAELVLGWLATNDWRIGVSSRVAARARIWITGFDEQGMARLSLIGGDPGLREIWLDLLRSFWSQLLDGIDQGMPQKNSANFQNLENMGDPHILKEIASQTAPQLAQAASIASSLPILWAGASKNHKAGKMILLNCQRLQTLLDDTPLLGSMAGFWRELAQSQGSDIVKFIDAAATFGNICARLSGKLAKF